jgi:uncharacterized protein
MNQKSKHLINFAIIIALLAFSYAIINVAGSYSRSIEPSSFKSFSISAEGDSIAVPDVAEFSFSVVTEGGNNVGSLQEENTEKMNEAIQFIKDQGVDEKDIKTQRYSLEPRYEHYRCEDGPCPPPEIVGYTIRQTAEVKIRDFETIGTIISGVVDHGANTVSQLSFVIDDPTEVENEARAEAIEKAKEKAEAIAKAGGFRVGQLLSIQESGQNDIYRNYAVKEMAMGSAIEEAGGTPAPSIEPGSEEVTVNVTLVYEIK